MQQTAQPDVFNLPGIQADTPGQPAGINGNPPGVFTGIGVLEAQDSADGGESGILFFCVIAQPFLIFD